MFPAAQARPMRKRGGRVLRGRGIKCENLDLPGGPVVKNPPASAEDAVLIPGLGRSHTPRYN